VTDLFSNNFLASVSKLSLEVRRAPVRGAHGAHLSAKAGQSLEFKDYQGYVAGDDLRRVDWNVYRRTRHLFVRRFEHPTQLPVFILVDGSQSMHIETPSRYTTAAKLAVAVASAGLASGNPVYLNIADGDEATTPRAVSGRRGLVRVMASLAAERKTNGPGIVESLRALAPLLATRGRGVLVIVSDFFEQEGVETIIGQLRSFMQRLVLLKVNQPWDTNPILESEDLELVDCESLTGLRVTSSQGVLNRYRAAYQAYFDAFESYARQAGATSVSIDASAEIVPQLETLFPAGVLRI
jgi:uncharacterized protein (DUF58 family)